MTIQDMVDLLNKDCPPVQDGTRLSFKNDPEKSVFQAKDGKWVMVEKGEAQVEPNIEAFVGGIDTLALGEAKEVYYDIKNFRDSLESDKSQSNKVEEPKNKGEEVPGYTLAELISGKPLQDEALNKLSKDSETKDKGEALKQ